MKTDTVAFAVDVRQVVCSIPAGSVLTYGDVAALAGSPASSRLVGKILGAIGMYSEVPCHRVVNFEGRIAPHWPEQELLLKAEGVTFRRTKYVDLTRHRFRPTLI